MVEECTREMIHESKHPHGVPHARGWMDKKRGEKLYNTKVKNISSGGKGSILFGGFVEIYGIYEH
jgi:hypothetical protein